MIEDELYKFGEELNSAVNQAVNNQEFEDLNKQLQDTIDTTVRYVKSNLNMNRGNATTYQPGPQGRATHYQSGTTPSKPVMM